MKSVHAKPVRKHFNKPSLTKQSFQKECNINNLMAKYQKTGLHSHVSHHQGNYGDFMQATDYHTAMNQIIAAGDAFNSVPAEIRAHFENDPGKFLAFVQDPENESGMRELGLLPTLRAPDPDTLDPAPTGPNNPRTAPATSSTPLPPAEQPS